jgi:hypothetical protein
MLPARVPPAASGRPSAFLRQHVAGLEVPRVDETAFRPAWRVRTRLDALERDGALSPREFRAAVAYRAAAELVLGSAVHAVALDGPGRAPGYRGDRLERSERLRDTLRHLTSVRQTLGDVATGLIEACVVEDLTWSALGRRLRCDHKTAKAWVVTAVKALAHAWS